MIQLCLYFRKSTKRKEECEVCGKKVLILKSHMKLHERALAKIEWFSFRVRPFWFHNKIYETRVKVVREFTDVKSVHGKKKWLEVLLESDNACWTWWRERARNKCVISESSFFTLLKTLLTNYKNVVPYYLYFIENKLITRMWGLRIYQKMA